jgi:hypothetical protein
MPISPGTEQSRDHVQVAAPSQPGRRKMSRSLLNFWLDAALLLAVTFVLWVSAVMQAVFPPPTFADGWELWGLSYNQWHNMQFVGLCVCALLALEHVVLHWNWVCSVIATQVLRVKARPDEGVQAVYGVATFIAILLAVLGSVAAAVPWVP